MEVVVKKKIFIKTTSQKINQNEKVEDYVPNEGTR